MNPPPNIDCVLRRTNVVDERGRTKLVCVRCGAVDFSKLDPARVHIVCKRPEGPGLLRRIANFLGATVVHVASGSELVAEAEVDRRLAICQACPMQLFNGVRCTHASCGCGISPDLPAYRSKLRWASSYCPIGAWESGPDLRQDASN